jgi:hypothetical protein
MSLPSPIIAVLAHFQPLFTAPTWRKVVLLLVGTSTFTRTQDRHSGTASGGTTQQCELQSLPSCPQPCALVGLRSESTTVASLGEDVCAGRRDGRDRD